MRSRTIQLIVAYDGTELSGYQRQQNGPTVQGYLEEALSKICNEMITIYGSSRTDAGVHAQCQVVAFTTTGTIPVQNIPRATIAHLPPSIVVKEAMELGEDWNPKEYIKGKEYRYTLHLGATVDPMMRLYAYHMKKELNVQAMKEAAQALEGVHDFTSFRGHNTTPQDPVKHIYAIRIIQNGSALVIHVLGDGFLYHMVRNIAGFLIDVGLGKYTPQQVGSILEAKDRSRIGKTAPAHGLCLWEVFFSQERIEEVIRQLS